MIEHRTPVASPAESARRPPDRPSTVRERQRRNSRLRALIPSLVVSAVIPIAAYFLLRPHVRSDAIALAIGGAVAVAWTLAQFAWRRQIDPIGVVSTLSFGVGLCVAVLTGGNALALKLDLAPLTGALGVACLVSAAVRRPLIPTLLRLAGRGGPAAARRPIAATVIIGATLFVHAATHIVLAVALPTSTFLKVSREVNWAVLGTGIVLLLSVTRRKRP